MTSNDPQVPWTDEQWARVNQVIQEEASRARVAATFLPLYGPLPPDTDFVRNETIGSGTAAAAPHHARRYHDHQAGDAAGQGVRARRTNGRPGDGECAGVVPPRRQRTRASRGRRGLQRIRRQAEQSAPSGGRPGGLPATWEIHGGEPSDGLWNRPPAGRIPPNSGVDRESDPRHVW